MWCVFVNYLVDNGYSGVSFTRSTFMELMKPRKNFNKKENGIIYLDYAVSQKLTLKYLYLK